MDRFAGQTLDVLIEEQISGDIANAADISDADNSGPDESLWLGRLYCHAPEVDGAAVIVGNGQASSVQLREGILVQCKVIARRGFDLEVSLV
jgi:ribosomal protein S12 methylthiotransferase